MTNNDEIKTAQQQFWDWLANKSKAFSDKTRWVYDGNKPHDDKQFVIEWLNQTNPQRKLALAITYGLVSIKDDGKFVTQNTQSRKEFEASASQKLALIYWRDVNQCAYCQRHFVIKKGGQIDHFIPRSAWPQEWLWLADDSSNLVASCSTCNQKKSNNYWVITTEMQMTHIPIGLCNKSEAIQLPDWNDYQSCQSYAQYTGKRQDCDRCPEIWICCPIHEEKQIPICWTLFPLVIGGLHAEF